MDDEELESISESSNEIPTNKTENELLNIDQNRVETNRIEQEVDFIFHSDLLSLIAFFVYQKTSFIRRRTQSLTLFGENQDRKVNIGVEWFVPILKRQQRSSSLHARSPSPPIRHSLSSSNPVPVEIRK